MPHSTIDNAYGCLLGGAVGDALGAPIEFLSIDAIRDKYGKEGIKDFSPAYGRVGAITDDTLDCRGIDTGIESLA